MHIHIHNPLWNRLTSQKLKLRRAAWTALSCSNTSSSCCRAIWWRPPAPCQRRKRLSIRCLRPSKGWNFQLWTWHVWGHQISWNEEVLFNMLFNRLWLITILCSKEQEPPPKKQMAPIVVKTWKFRSRACWKTWQPNTLATCRRTWPFTGAGGTAEKCLTARPWIYWADTGQPNETSPVLKML